MMPRDFHSHERDRRAKAKRENVLVYRDPRSAPAARVHGSSPFSFPAKAVDPELRRMIDEALAKRGARP
jgi:hypothetical protein